MIYNGHVNKYAFNKGCSFTLAPLPIHKPLKIKPGKKSEKTLYMSETRIEIAISKSKPLFTLLMVESNTMRKWKPYIL